MGKAGPAPSVPRCARVPSSLWLVVKRDPATGPARGLFLSWRCIIEVFIRANRSGIGPRRSCQKLRCRPCVGNAYEPHPADLLEIVSCHPLLQNAWSTPANVIGTPLGPTMRGTANSFFGGRSNGRSWRRRKSERRPRRLPPSRLGPFSPEYAKCSGLLGVFPLCSKRT
jgi:hypothetical protein